MPIDLLRAGDRKAIIDEITAEENKERKEESLRRFNIYRERQRNYILERLRQEFSQKTVREMRTITSINLCKRMIDEVASIYKNSPERTFEGASDNEKEVIENHYEVSQVNVKMKLANKYYKLEDQCAIYVVPKMGKLDIRILLPHHYDVIPHPNDPTKAWGYVINILDRTEFNQDYDSRRDIVASPTGGRTIRHDNSKNEKIADSSDFKEEVGRYVWWTPEYNFMTNGSGNLIDMNGDTLEQINMEDIINPIGELPFIDIAGEKDSQFWVEYGNGFVDFSIDFGVLLSDVANVNRLQGYSQAVLASEESPADLQVGPHSVIHLPINPESDAPAPTFQFVNPSPDMKASLELLEVYLRTFLSSKGIDPKTLSGRAEASYSSGVERLLSMIEKFEASRDDIDLFKDVEMKLFHLIKTWHNLLTETDDGLSDDLQGPKISDEIFVSLKYSKPEMHQTQKDIEESVERRRKNGLMSRKEAIMELRGVDEDEALRIIDEIESDERVMLRGTDIGFTES